MVTPPKDNSRGCPPTDEPDTADTADRTLPPPLNAFSSTREEGDLIKRLMVGLSG
jgi:hypothetical protein